MSAGLSPEAVSRSVVFGKKFASSHSLKDLGRSELMARLIALIYNWWSIYTKLVDETLARETITSRPMLVMHTAKVSIHQSVATLMVFCAHTQAQRIKEILEVASERLKQWASLTAKQLKIQSGWSLNYPAHFTQPSDDWTWK